MDEAKRVLVQEWLAKAYRDLCSAEKLGKDPQALLDTAIYHCQQAAEKAVKGFLVCRDRRFEKTHDVQVLVKSAAADEPRFNNWVEAGEVLTPYAVAYRYPAATALPSREEFDEALRLARDLFAFVLSLLPPEARPVGPPPSGNP
ncbi:MAG: HEPN domain-containing protein [Phycisphaerae bacterium]